MLSLWHPDISHLREMIASLRSQSSVDVQILVHVDGGVEEDALRLVEDALPTSRCMCRGQELGVPGAFLAMLRMAPKGFDLYAYADQDDIWHPEKLVSSWSHLAGSGGRPALWVCGYREFSLSEVAEHETRGIRVARRAGLGNALVETLAPGCAMVWNETLQCLLASRIPEPTAVVMHDSWTYLVSTVVGDVIVDSRILLNYRLHDRNAIGASNGLAPRLRRWTLGAGGRRTWARQAEELRMLWGDRLDKRSLALVSRTAALPSLSGVLCFATGKLWRSRWTDSVMMIAAILLRFRV